MPLSAPQDCALAHETSGGVERRALRVTRRLRHPLCRSVKRERSGNNPWSRVSFGQWVGRMLGSHRAARL